MKFVRVFVLIAAFFALFVVVMVFANGDNQHIRSLPTRQVFVWTTLWNVYSESPAPKDIGGSDAWGAYQMRVRELNPQLNGRTPNTDDVIVVPW